MMVRLEQDLAGVKHRPRRLRPVGPPLIQDHPDESSLLRSAHPPPFNGRTRMGDPLAFHSGDDLGRRGDIHQHWIPGSEPANGLFIGGLDLLLDVHRIDQPLSYDRDIGELRCTGRLRAWTPEIAMAPATTPASMSQPVECPIRIS